MAVCGRFVGVSVRLLIGCSRMLMVCGSFWSFAGFGSGLWLSAGGLWWFAVVACFSNYDLQMYSKECLLLFVQ